MDAIRLFHVQMRIDQPNDLTLRFLETVLTILSMCYVYDMLISHFGDNQYVLHVPWTIDMFTIFQGLVGAAVQSYFAYRVFKVSKWWITPMFVWFGSLARVAICIVVATMDLRFGDLAAVVDRIGSVISTSFSISVAMDIINTVSLTWFLVTNRNSGLARYSITFQSSMLDGCVSTHAWVD